MNADWSNFFSALAGGGIAGVATLWAQMINATEQRKREEIAEEKLIRGFVQAIADEVKSVWDRYNVEIGPHLKSLDLQKAARVFPVHQNYFVVFDSGASLIGRVQDMQLRERIISTYVDAKGFVDSLQYYKQLVAEYDAIPEPTPTAGALIAINTASMDKFAQLVEYSQKLKEEHSRVEAKFNALRDSLQGYLNRS